MKIEIEFDADFEGNKALPIHVGRIMIGTHIARIGFFPDGKVRMFIEKRALTDGSLVLIESYGEDEMLMLKPER